MRIFRLPALDAFDPLGYMAALGALRLLARQYPESRLRWVEDGTWVPEMLLPEDVDIIEVLAAETDRLRRAHAALDFAIGADRKTQDLKQPPAVFRTFMREFRADTDVAEYVTAYATGVAVDGSGHQGKPTSFHMTAGQQRFMDVILSLRDCVTTDDLKVALYGPWIGRKGPKDPRWRAASDRSRALLWFDPGKEATTTIVGAAWLAFHALPLFPVVPIGLRARTTAFTGRGRSEQFTWPVWSPALTAAEVRVALGLKDIGSMPSADRAARGIAAVLRADVTRSAQGYGNFSAAVPV